MRALGLALGGLRFDTTNTGEPETTKGEAECAQWVAEQLAAVGYAPHYVESGALLIHGHLDVVPAEPTEWSVHPFSGAPDST
ncbi:hypothetical protein JHV675_54080 [Mycobacterium avium subsp. hominissuis]